MDEGGSVSDRSRPVHDAMAATLAPAVAPTPAALARPRRPAGGRTRVKGRPRGAVGLVSLALLVGCGAGEYRHLAGPAMGTSYRVVARCVPGLEEQAVATALADLDGVLSNWDDDSEISRFHRVPPGAWVELSPTLAAVMRAALEVSAASGGAFDVTVGALVDAWGFGPRSARHAPATVGRGAAAELAGRVPDRAAVDAARRRVGHRFLEMDGRRLRRTGPVRIDLAALAKGHAVDVLADGLEATGCGDYVVEIGGEVRARGNGPAGRPWRVAIESPDPSGTGPATVIELRGGAIATSGDYRSFTLDGGLRRPHVIDPRTGAPVRHALASVSVVHRSAMWADAYATLLLVLGPERGLSFADAHGLAAYLVLRGRDGFKARHSAAMAAYLSR